MGGNLKDLGVQYWLPVKEKEKLLVKSSWAPITLNTFEKSQPKQCVSTVHYAASLLPQLP